MSDKFIVIEWPDSQEIMDWDGFEDNAFLVCDEHGMEVFGSSAYFVDEDWYAEQCKAEHSETNETEFYYQPVAYSDNETDIVPNLLHSFQVFRTEEMCYDWLVEHDYDPDDFTVVVYCGDDIEDHHYINEYDEDDE